MVPTLILKMFESERTKCMEPIDRCLKPLSENSDNVTVSSLISAYNSLDKTSQNKFLNQASSQIFTNESVMTDLNRFNYIITMVRECVETNSECTKSNDFQSLIQTLKEKFSTLHMFYQHSSRSEQGSIFSKIVLELQTIVNVYDFKKLFTFYSSAS